MLLLPIIKYGGIWTLASASKLLTTVTYITQIILSLKMFFFIIYHRFLIIWTRQSRLIASHSVHFSCNNCTFHVQQKANIQKNTRIIINTLLNVSALIAPSSRRTLSYAKNNFENTIKLSLRMAQLIIIYMLLYMCIWLVN